MFVVMCPVFAPEFPEVVGGCQLYPRFSRDDVWWGRTRDGWDYCYYVRTAQP